MSLELKEDQKTVVKFSASWCGACKQLDPVIDEIRNDGYSVQTIDIDSNQDLAMKYNVRSLPTTIVFNGSDPIKTIIGVKAKSEYMEALS